MRSIFGATYNKRSCHVCRVRERIQKRCRSVNDDIRNLLRIVPAFELRETQRAQRPVQVRRNASVHARDARCRNRAARHRPRPAVVSTALQVSRPLHFGDYGGLPLKIIWALLDLAAIVVLASGLYLWLGKRKSPRVATHAAERPAVAAASGVGS
ncbi:PepSY-associated TM helix domain-containing protein [Bradyrhizobium sp. AZCC 2262]|uniref:PepSY-associated TM helix domain-containing protein n=1 Tax=Bradyrhizobium sp. AZCC 2262 TaxID=3117022 RepID=UPI002FF23372